jgi:hypothetical protein
MKNVTCCGQNKDIFDFKPSYLIRKQAFNDGFSLKSNHGALIRRALKKGRTLLNFFCVLNNQSWTYILR